MYLVVRGDSMLPTYQNGDLLVIMRQTVTASARRPPIECPPTNWAPAGSSSTV